MAEHSIALTPDDIERLAPTAAPASHAAAEAAPRKRKGGTTTRNPVIAAAAKISAVLDALDPPIRANVVNFIAQQYLC